MPDKYKNKYKIESMRLKNWNYSSNGYYYITICTKNREHFFGNIKNNKVILNKIGEIANKNWIDIPNHFENIKLGNFIIMPNHIHGIILIVETLHATSLHNNDIQNNKNYDIQNNQNDCFSKISPKPKSLSAIIRSYKSSVTRIVREKFDETFTWQPRFYDRIIRNEKELNIIRNYIKENPKKWDEDELNE